MLEKPPGKCQGAERKDRSLGLGYEDKEKETDLSLKRRIGFKGTTQSEEDTLGQKDVRTRG